MNTLAINMFVLVLAMGCQPANPITKQQPTSTTESSEPKGLDKLISHSGAIITADVVSFEFVELEMTLQKATRFKLCNVMFLAGGFDFPMHDGCLSVTSTDSYLIPETHHLLFLTADSPYHNPTVDGPRGAFATADPHGRSCARQGAEIFARLEDGNVLVFKPWNSNKSGCVTFARVLEATQARIELTTTHERSLPEDWRFEPPE